jgi:hypothetical protein
VAIVTAEQAGGNSHEDFAANQNAKPLYRARPVEQAKAVTEMFLANENIFP